MEIETEIQYGRWTQDKARNMYTSKDISFIIPTKDRPEKMKNLLESISLQTGSFGRIIVIDGGKSVRDIVLSFAGCLPVEYHECSPPGQIRQRNMGISLLDDRTPLVGFLDDDIVWNPRRLKV